MRRRVIIVGGVAGGATAAARARRLSEDAEIIMLERGPDISFANCGLPYHIGGEITQRDKLVLQTAATLGKRYALDIRTRHEVRAINPATKTVCVFDIEQEREYEETYDDLILSPGAEPIRPPLPGADLPSVHTLRNLPDTDRIKAAVDQGAKDAIVVGGGFIGLEMAESLRRRGLNVSLVERLPQVMPPLDAEMAAPLHEELVQNGVCLYLEEAVQRFDATEAGVSATLGGGQTIEADFAILAVGVRPDTKLAKDAGLSCNERGAIVVDDHMRTSDPHIYAVGDAVEVRDAVLGNPAMIPLAGPANRQARIAADNIFGRDSRYRGTQGTSIVHLFSKVAASTGLSEKALVATGTEFRKVYVTANHHVAYYPGAQPMLIKLLFGSDDGRVFGAQIIGGDGVDKRIDVIAMAIQARMTVFDLEEAELAYAPQFGAAKDPVNMIGFVASNLLREDERFVYAEEFGEDAADQWTILDVREAPDFEAGHMPGAVSVPLSELRDRLADVPRDKPIATVCYSGQRAYYADRLLRHHGLDCSNIAGGMRVVRQIGAEAGCPASPSSSCGG